MPYKDKEAGRKAKREWAKKNRQGSTKGSTGSTESLGNVEPNVEPNYEERAWTVEPVSNPNNPLLRLLENRVDLLEEEVRTLRKAFGSLNSLLKQVDEFKADLECLKERMALSEDKGIKPESRKDSIRVQKTTTGNGEPVTIEICSICPKHGRLKIPGAKTNCC